MVALFAGGVVGGCMFKSAVGMAGALWFAAGLKGVVGCGWFVWRGVGEGEGKEKRGQGAPTVNV